LNLSESTAEASLQTETLQTPGVVVPLPAVKVWRACSDSYQAEDEFVFTASAPPKDV